MKRRLVSAATAMAARVGYTLMPTWRLHNLSFTSNLQQLFASRGVDCVIDVGANDGGYGRFLRNEVGFTGLILSFEPVSALAQQCRDNSAHDPLWHVLPYALGAESGQAEINVSAFSKLSSFLPLTDAAAGHMPTDVSIEHIETVQVRRLDEVLPPLRQSHGFSRPYLKIDTQGYDLAVIAGAGDQLATMIAAQTELSFQPLYEGMPTWREVIDTLGSHGFSVSGMFPVIQDRHLRAIELDCLLINDRLLPPA